MSSISMMPRRPLMPRANCTHMKMGLVRVDANVTCDLCGKSPRTCQMFVCQQDEMKATEPIGGNEPPSSPYSAAIAEMYQLNISQSVIDHAKLGLYTPAQMTKLINQRKGVFKAIEQDTGIKYQPPTMQNNQSFGMTGMSALPSRGPSAAPSTGRSYIARFKEMTDKSIIKCKGKICPTCRPNLKEHVMPIIDSVITTANQASLNQTLATEVIDVRVVRHIGLNTTASRSYTYFSAYEEMPSGLSSSSSSYQEGEAVAEPQGTAVCKGDVSVVEKEHTNDVDEATALAQLFASASSSFSNTYDAEAKTSHTTFSHATERRSSVPGSAHTPSDFVLRGTTGKPSHFAAGPDNHADNTRKGSSTSLPDRAPSNESEALRGIPMSRQSSEGSTMAEEVHVEGGVALTEESIESGTPDVITEF